MMYTITVNVECSNDLIETLVNPDLVLEGAISEMVAEFCDFVSVHEVKISPSLLEDEMPPTSDTF